MELEQVPAISDDDFFPISKHAWVQSSEESMLSLVNTGAYIAQDETWRGLDHFHQLALVYIAFNAQRTAHHEIERLKAEADFNQRAIENTLVHLAAAIEAPSSKPPALAEGDSATGAGALLAACHMIGEASGIMFRAPPSAREQLHSLNTVSAFLAESTKIALASKVHWREVHLEAAWWRQDNGPLLGYLVEDGHPVALLPSSARSYTAYDPINRTHVPVTPHIAAQLAPKAIMFYRPLPEGALSVQDIIQFGLRGNTRDLLTLLLAGAGGGLLALIVPLATGLLFEAVIPAGSYNQLVQLSLAFLAAALGAATFEITRSIAVLRLEGKLDTRIQSAVWDRLLRLPVAFFRAYSAGDLAYRAASIDTIRQLVAGGTITALLSAIFSLFSFGLLFYYNAKLALVTTGLILVILGITSLASILQLRYQRQLLDMEGRLASHVLQWLTGITKLRVAGAEARTFALWGRSFAWQRQLAFKVRSIGNTLAVLNAIYPLLINVVIFATLAANDYPLPPGDFLAFNAALGQFVVAVLAVNTVITSVLRAVPTFERVKPILEAQPEVDTRKAHPGQLSGEIEISHVSFRYPLRQSDEQARKPALRMTHSEQVRASGPWVLNDISLHIRPGEFVAIVGPSGAGKSTLLRLLLGFESPQSGSIYYDNQDLAGLDLQATRRQIGVVLQDGKLMPGSIFDNIAGSSWATTGGSNPLDDAWEAARIAGLDRDIERLPMGIHTMVMEEGRTFSGGQRQRLLIARAIVSKPRILFFDEATNSLDNASQEQVTRSLDNLHATRLVIAHRLSTIINADRIYVLVAGSVVQSGTYEALINQAGPFADLVKRQIL